MSLANLISLGLGALALAAGQADRRPILVESFEGDSPDIESVRFAGRFPHDRFTVAVARRADHWFATVTGLSAAPVVVRFSSARFRPILVSEIGLASRAPGERYYLVVIRYGEPLAECFSNGGEVLRHLTLRIDRSGFVGAENATFRGCERIYETFPVRRTRGVYAIE